MRRDYLNSTAIDGFTPKSSCHLFADGMQIGATATSGYDNPYSLLMDGAAHYLSRTPSVSTASNRQMAVFYRLRRWGLGTQQALLEAANAGVDVDKIEFTSGDQIRVKLASGGDVTTVAVFRDVLKYYFIYIEFDLNNATAADRIKIYVNGSRQSVTGTNATSANFSYFKTTTVHKISDSAYSAGSAWGKFNINEFYLFDGVLPGVTSLEQTDSSSGQQVSVSYSGSFGTNGSRLRFRDAASTTTLGYDDSGNGNHWTLNSMATTDRLTDSPANTQAILNVLDPPTNTTISEGGLAASIGSGKGAVRFTMPGKSKKRMFEVTGSAFTTSGGIKIGCSLASYALTAAADLGASTDGFGVRANASGTDFFQYNGSSANLSADFTANSDVCGVAVDFDTGDISIYKNGVSVYTTNIPAIVGQVWFPTVANETAATTKAFTINSGQKPFAYPISGYTGYGTASLPTPPVRKASLGFTAQLWTGTGAALDISLPFDISAGGLAWMKGRSGATDHALYDTVRGVQKQLESNSTGAETTETTGVTAFNSASVSIGSLAQINTSAATYVGWFWKRAAQLGFDIIADAGTGVAHTVAHGLSRVPDKMVRKNRTTGSTLWATYHAQANASPAAGYLDLSATSAFTAASNVWNNTAPTSSVFSVGTSQATNENGSNFVTYLWAAIDGFSAFPKHTGTGSADGAFVWCGLRQLWSLTKSSSGAFSWMIYDAARDTYNPVDLRLAPDASAAEASSGSMDYTAGGVKMRANDANTNGASTTYVNAVFGDPFKTANAV